MTPNDPKFCIKKSLDTVFKDEGLSGIRQGTSIKNLVLANNSVTISYLIHYDSFLQNVTDVYYKKHQVFLQNVTVLLQKCNSYYKLVVITKWYIYYRLCHTVKDKRCAENMKDKFLMPVLFKFSCKSNFKGST